MPHPLEDKILFRIQTKEGYNAGDFLKRGLKELEQVFGAVRKTFEARSVVSSTPLNAYNRSLFQARMNDFESKIDVL